MIHGVLDLEMEQTYCVVAQDDDVPVYDVLLAQAMLIQHAEEEFLATANKV